MARRKRYMGKRRHPSSCRSAFKYLSRKEDDLSDGIQHGALRDEETGDVNFGAVGGLGAGVLGGAALGAAGMALGVAGLGPAGLLLAGKQISKARHAKAYNEGYEEANVDAMGELDNIGFS